MTGVASFRATGSSTIASVLRVGGGQSLSLQVLNWRLIQAMPSRACGAGFVSGRLVQPGKIEVTSRRATRCFRIAMH